MSQMHGQPMGFAGGGHDALVQDAIRVMQSGQPQVAMATLQHVLAANPAHPLATSIMAICVAQVYSAKDALPWFERVTQLVPEAADAWGNLGTALMNLREPVRARAAFERALAINPETPNAERGIIYTLNEEGRFNEACERFLASYQHRSSPQDSLIAGLPTMLTVGRAREMVDVIRWVRERAPTVDRPWLDRRMMMPMLYWDGTNADGSLRPNFPEEVAASIRQCGFGIASQIPPDPKPFTNVRDPEKKIRIGYLSQDFRNQACGHFLEPLFEHFDRDRFEVYGYSINAFGRDALTDRLAGWATRFVEVQNESDASFHERVRADGIDILVDAIVYSSPDRLRAMARRPAPVIVNYLGYPHSGGLPTMQWRLVDEETDPAGFERLSTEKLWRLKRCFMGYVPPHHMPEPTLREPPGRRAGGGGAPVFGSFQTLVKVQPSVIASWCRILKRVPGSTLIFKSKPLEHADIAAFYQAQFEANGVGPDQAVFMSYTKTREEHLALYGQIDVALDAWPYNGMTTTFEAMWMGVPVVAIAGDQPHARVSASILRYSGCGELVANSTQEFEDLAVSLVTDHGRWDERLAEWRTGLRRRMRETVADAPAHTRAVEDAWRGMWRAWCANPV